MTVRWWFAFKALFIVGYSFGRVIMNSFQDLITFNSNQKTNPTQIPKQFTQPFLYLSIKK